MKDKKWLIDELNKLKINSEIFTYDCIMELVQQLKDTGCEHNYEIANKCNYNSSTGHISVYCKKCGATKRIEF